MEIKIKKYKYEEVEIESKIIKLPSETSYYFETGVRRSIKIIPTFTTWNKERYDKDEELYRLDIICLYQSSECFAEKFSIYPKDIEKIYYSKDHEYKSFIDALVNEFFDNRTKEQFERDLESVIKELSL